MGYDINVSKKQGGIIIYPLGEFTRQDIDELLEKISNIRKEYGMNKIVCDQRRLQVPPSIATIIETAQRFTEDPFTGMKLAIVRKTIPNEMHLFETVVSNRSGVVKIFDDEEKAWEWLGSQN
ncbi:MAG: STAS/SEC14 domain-containing protein [Elusimicrobia bacterium]|nr:STAS/SEC14 domain-containing protein [Elusimicrobiota bacterium]